MQRVILVVVLFLVSICGWSVNYYCDPVNGNMSNPGTLASPWGSLEAVFNQGLTFNGGDKIYLMNGILNLNMLMKLRDVVIVGTEILIVNPMVL